MGSLGGLLGTSGGAGGTGFAGPQGVNLVNPVTGEQLSQANTGTQNSLEAQQKLLQAIQQQNGLGNQSQIYNQLQNIAAGTGPNPAQAMLNQATGQNVANQAALMAGQRGASVNPALIARQAAQQGAALQQQAVGQGATMQAQQALNAINSAGGVANTQASNQIGQTNANTAAQQAQQQALFNAQAAYNNAQVGMQSNINSGNAALANTQLQNQAGLSGGLLQGAGLALAAADGGEVPTLNINGNDSAFSNAGPQSKFGQFLNGMGSQMSQPVSVDGSMPSSGAGAIKQGLATLGQGLGKYLKGAPAPLQSNMAGEALQSSPDVLLAALGGVTHDYRAGGNVKAKNPKQKAVVTGNSYANDKIPAVLSEGEVVIPRNVMQSKDPVNGAAQFVQSVLAKRKVKS